MDKLFVYVFASFNEPMYKKMVEIRIEQMRKRKIPFMFLINGPMDYSVDLREGEYTLDTSTFMKGGPHVVLHFQQFLQDLYSKPESVRYFDCISGRGYFALQCQLETPLKGFKRGDRK